MCNHCHLSLAKNSPSLHALTYNYVTDCQENHPVYRRELELYHTNTEMSHTSKRKCSFGDEFAARED